MSVTQIPYHKLLMKVFEIQNPELPVDEYSWNHFLHYHSYGIQEAIGSLPKNDDIIVIKMSFGIGQKESTSREIGDLIKLSYQSVANKLNSACARLLRDKHIRASATPLLKLGYKSSALSKAAAIHEVQKRLGNADQKEILTMDPKLVWPDLHDKTLRAMEGITTVDSLRGFSEKGLLRKPFWGLRQVKEVRTALAEFGLGFAKY